MQVPQSVLRIMLGGQERIGASMSFTVMLKEQVVVRLPPSEAFHWTTVVPLGKALPLAVLLGLSNSAIGLPQLSVVVGV